MNASSSPRTWVRLPAVPLLVITAACTLLAGCPKEVAGARPSDVRVRRVNEGADHLTENQRKTAEEMRGIAAARRVEAMRLAFVKDAEQNCERDDECTLAQEHCCTCAFKGRLVGMNRASIPTLAQRRTAVCSDYQCVAQVSDDPSCNAQRARCRKGKCVPEIDEASTPPAGVGVEPIADEKTP